MATVGVALVEQRRGWPVDPASLWLHCTDEGRCDAVAILPDRVLLLPGDARVGDGDPVPDLNALYQAVAHSAVAGIDRTFAAIKARSKYGRRGMWGSVADAVGQLTVHRAAGQPAAAVERSYGEAMRFARALASAAGRRPRLPSLGQVDSPTGPRPAAIRGTLLPAAPAAGVPRSLRRGLLPHLPAA